MDILTLRVLLVVLCVSRGREATDNYKNYNKEMLGFRGGGRDLRVSGGGGKGRGTFLDLGEQNKKSSFYKKDLSS